MKARQKHQIEMYQRVQVFLRDNPLAPPASYGGAGEQLDEVVTHLTTHSGSQAASRRLSLAETERQRTLRQQLREQHLLPIARIANAMLRGSPGIDKATRMPSAKLKTTRLLAEAVAFREAAAPYEETFVRQGLAADFLALLDTAIEDLRKVQQDQERTRNRNVGAKAGLVSEVARGRQAVQMLDAIVKARFTRNAEVLEQWQRAKRVKGVGGGSSSGPAPSVQQSDTKPAPAEPKAA